MDEERYCFQRRDVIHSDWGGAFEVLGDDGKSVYFYRESDPHRLWKDGWERVLLIEPAKARTAPRNPDIPEHPYRRRTAMELQTAIMSPKVSVLGRDILGVFDVIKREGNSFTLRDTRDQSRHVQTYYANLRKPR